MLSFVSPVLSFLLPLAFGTVTLGRLSIFLHVPSLVGIVCSGYLISAAIARSNIVPPAFLRSDHPQAALLYHKNKGFAYQLAPLLPALLFFTTSVVYIEKPDLIGPGIAYAVLGLMAALGLMAWHLSRELETLDGERALRVFRSGLLKRFVVASAFSLIAVAVFFYTVFFAMSGDLSITQLSPFRMFAGAEVRFQPLLLARFLGLALALALVNAPRLARRRAVLAGADYAALFLCALCWATGVATACFFVKMASSLYNPQPLAEQSLNFILHHLLVLAGVGAAWAGLALRGAAPAVSDLRQPVWTHRRGAAAAWAALFTAGFVGSMVYTESSVYSVAAAVLFFGAVALAMSSRRKLEDIIQERTLDLNVEKQKVEGLLQNILPGYVIEDLKLRGASQPRSFENVAVLFTDFVGFTRMSTRLDPAALIGELNEMFTAFDAIMLRRGAERIKTIGDGYMAVAGLGGAPGEPAATMVECAREILAYVEGRNRSGRLEWKIRIGIAAGPGVGGVVGTTKYLFDLFGDTINTASRMESNSQPMRINVSEEVYRRLKDRCAFVEREPVEVKGKGPMKMYFVG